MFLKLAIYFANNFAALQQLALGVLLLFEVTICFEAIDGVGRLNGEHSITREVESQIAVCNLRLRY